MDIPDRWVGKSGLAGVVEKLRGRIPAMAASWRIGKIELSLGHIHGSLAV